MSELRSAAQQALEALEFMADEWGFTHKANRPERWQAIDALRAALKQPERTLTDEKSDQALRQQVEGWYQHTLDCMERLKSQNSGKHIKELLTPEFTNHMSNASILKNILKNQKERTLTDEVIADLWHKNGGFHHHFARAVERWLKGEE
jgi:DNA phosphorothioation-dependent restriction protein DptG